MSRDPIGGRGGLNLYTFCGNQPLTSVDPDGRFVYPGIVLHPGYTPQPDTDLWPWEGCCGEDNKKYNRFKQCCCCAGGKRVRNGGKDCKLIEKSTRSKTTVCIWETKGGEHDPNAYHQWVGWTDWDGTPRSCGYNHRGNRTTICPDPEDTSRRNDLNGQFYSPTYCVEINPCKQNLKELIKCLNKEFNNPTQRAFSGLCRGYAGCLVSKCESAARGGCTYDSDGESAAK